MLFTTRRDSKERASLRKTHTGRNETKNILGPPGEHEPREYTSRRGDPTEAHYKRNSRYTNTGEEEKSIGNPANTGTTLKKA